MNHRGLTLIRLILVVLAIGILLAAAFILVTREQARARDAKRVADMARLAAAFELLRADRASYEPAAQGGCNQIGLPASSCNLFVYFPDIATLRDPGGFAYLVSAVPVKENYAIAFSLERGYDGMAKGPHSLTPAGIR